MSASFWMGARLRWASATICTIRARSVSAPTRSARITSPPVPFTVAPVTRSPGRFSTGIGSPVTIDSSIELVPSRTTPSTGTLAPRSLEIDRHLPRFLPERCGEDPGEQRRNQAVEVRNADAEPDEGEHVQAAVHDRLPPADGEGPPPPEDDGSTERELEPSQPPGGRKLLQGAPGDEIRHCDEEQRNRENGAYPKP